MSDTNPDPQHQHTPDETDNPADTQPAEGTDPDPGELPEQIPDP